ncbi:amidohydrolase [Pseudemcibacter aquimaris]|uniref:amidohydrolase n=1 Tax=Pseudemcibacter aquimaris TaxID=2857064 RepID=UPI002012EDEC|nr:amidohydrolase [Pseudemcibacter aquimaris]MCC3862423.1 amidohydrolase [Pseudemcibacter aquimaris]WDU59147.1 amidohydrolase [Pseudemcibacter aquimaris]
MQKLTILLITMMMVITGCSNNSENAAQPQQDPASMVLMGGNVITVDDQFSLKTAVAIQGKRIIAVGSDEDIKAYIGSDTNVIDLAGKTVLPGLIDVHGHIHSYGRLLQNLDLNNTKSYAEIIAMVKAKAETLEPGEWIIGQGWDQNNWDEKIFPTQEPLSAVSPNNPVILNRTDGHAILANKNAMDIAGITNDTPDPDGGKIIRNEAGEATGVFVDLAEELIRQYEPVTDKNIADRLTVTADKALSVGLTMVHDLGTSPAELKVFKAMAENGEFDMRVNVMFDNPAEEIDYRAFFKENKIENIDDHMLMAKGIKLYRDGALGSRGALLTEPYHDDTHNYGIEVATQEEVYEISKAAIDTGIQIVTHAIGDEAVSTTLNSYEKAFNETGKQDHRFRMEHAQIIHEEDVNRFVELGVIPGVQPGSVITDMDWTETRIGPERIKRAYLFRDFLNTGTPLIFSSDFPTESINPFEGMYRAVTRMHEDGTPANGWNIEQAVTIEEAIKAHTIWAAYSSFDEDILGSIETGKYADLIVIDRDVLSIESTDLKNVQVEYTIVGGDIKYSKN